MNRKAFSSLAILALIALGTAPGRAQESLEPRGGADSARAARGSAGHQSAAEAASENEGKLSGMESTSPARRKESLLGKGFGLINGVLSGKRLKRSRAVPSPARTGGIPIPLQDAAGGGGDAQESETVAKIAELRRLAVSNFRKKRIAEAIRNINDLITLKPYEADYHLALALCYRKQGRYRDALKKYDDVLDLGGPKALVSLLKAEAYAAEGRKDKAYEMLKEAALGGRNIINDVQNMPLLKPFASDTEFIKLALQLERFTVNRRGLRDPFTNPFPKATGQEVGLPEPAQRRLTLTPEEQQEILRETKKTYEQIQFFIKLQDEEKAMAAYLRLKELLKKEPMLTIPKIVNDFKTYSGRLKDIEIQISAIRLRYYYAQAKEKINAMRELFRDGDYTRVIAVHQDIENLAREMIAANQKYRRVADEILAHSRKLVERAKVRLEFENQKPQIQGIIISGDDKLTIINNRIVKQGETIDDFRVVRVESNRVTFRYKGEEIPLVFRRY